MSLYCQKTCKMCQDAAGSGIQPSPSPSLAAPTCTTEPDSGTACAFFLETLPDPCHDRDTFVQAYVRWGSAVCQSECAFCLPA
jgi:hypothetical protein